MAERGRWTDLAERQHGVIGRSQLTGLGVGSEAVRHAVRRGGLRWLGPRVLCVPGSADTPMRRVWAAVIDSRGGAVALASAVALRGVPHWRLEPVHVLTTRRPHRGGSHLGVVHSTVRLAGSDVVEVDGLPVTSPARTLLDLSLRLHPGKVEALCDDLLRRKLLTTAQLHDLVSELPPGGGPRGYVLLRRLPAARGVDYLPTGSRLERRFEEIIEEAGEDPFERQLDLGDDDGWIGRVDFADRRRKVVVEVQGETFHSSISDRRRDAERTARLRSAGWIVIEITEREIVDRPDEVVRRVRAARALAPSIAA